MKITTTAAIGCFSVLALGAHTNVYSQSAKEVAALRQQVTQNNDKINALEKTFSAIQSKLDDGGWKALDTATQLANMQWQIIGFFLGLTATIAAVAGFGGVQAYKLLRDKLEGEIKDSMKGHESILRHSTGALAFGQLSMGFWEQYSTLPGGEPEGEKRRLLNAAILLSGFALKYADDLEPLAGEKYEDLITNIRANHAYWLAAQPDPSDPWRANRANSAEALATAKKAFMVAAKYMKAEESKYIHRWPDWAESYCFVLTRFGDDGQRAAAREIIKAVCDDLRVDETWRRATKKEYFG